MSANPPDLARLLAEAHAARAVLSAPAAGPAITTGALWAHARRRPGEPVDFSVARALKTDPIVAARYRKLLGSVAAAHAPFAIAASDGAIRERRVGAYALTLTPADDGAPPLLVIACGTAKGPGMMEFVRDGVSSRLELPEAVDGAIVMALDPSFEDAAAIADDFADASTEIFLIGRMKLLVIVPTTGGPAILRRLKVRQGLPVSSAFVDGDYRPLPWSADYARLAGPGGPIARALKKDLPPHELRLDQSFDAGRSWESPVSAAHLLLAAGDVELTDAPESADLLVWTTGAVDLDLSLIPGDYAVADKLERSRALFEAARRIVIALPPGTPPDAAKPFESDPKIQVVRGATARAIADAALGREPVAAAAPKPSANARLTRWVGIAGLVVACIGTAGVFLADDKAPPQRVEDPKPAEDPKPIVGTAPPLDPPSVIIAEVRAPQGGACEQVLFGSVRPETREVERAGPDAFAPSRLDGALCGLVIRPAVAGGTVEVTGGLSTVTGAPRPAPGGGTLYMLRAGARQKVVYEAQGLSKDPAAPSGRMRHELVP